MKTILFTCLIFIQYAAANTLYKKCKADANNICVSVSISKMLADKDAEIMALKKDIWETTDDFSRRKEARQLELEKNIIKAINEEVSTNGAGKATMTSYDADSSIMKLSLAWNKNIKDFLKKKAMPERVILFLDRKVAKNLFATQRTQRFNINVQYDKHRFEVTKIYLRKGSVAYAFMHDVQWLNTEDMRTSKCVDFNGVDCKADWKTANSICENSGGRLPNIKELKSVYDACNGNSVCLKTFGFSKLNNYWSSTTYADNSDNAWYVNFSYGNQDYDNKTYSLYVRCVRAGQ